MAGGEVPARGNVIPFIPARYILAVLSSIGMAIIYGLKVNLSVAMVAMVNHTALELMGGDEHGSTGSTDNNSTVEECQADERANGTSSNQDGPFEWSGPSQGVILSCYFWGYFVSQIPGAKVAELFSAKWVMWFAVFINVLGTVLTPAAAYVGVWAVVIMRVLEGIGGGVTFPAEHTLIAAWAPPQERSTISSIVYAGTALGTVISMLMAGMLAEFFGWSSIFYVMGLLSCVWLLLWIIFIQDSPNKQPLIDQAERDYINTSLNVGSGGGHGHSAKKTPWREIFRSRPFYGILIAHMCNNVGWYMLLIELPIYMNQVLKFQIKENAIYTATPFLTLWFFSIFISKTLDTLRAHGKITTTTARKIATLIASVVPMFCLLALCFIGCNKMGAVVIAGVGVTAIGAMFSGFLSNHIDIAPNYAGILMAVTNTMATLPGISVPIFVGILTKTDKTIASWRIIFGITIVLYIVEIIAYVLLGSGDEQPWNKSEEEKSGPELTPLKDKQHADYKTKHDA